MFLYLPHNFVLLGQTMDTSSTTSLAKHPLNYTVFQPNLLIGANNELNVSEARVYSEILNFKHRDEPDVLVYTVPYELVTPLVDRNITRKSAAEVLRITQSLQKRVFFLNKELMQTHFGEKHPVSINPFPIIRYVDGAFEVHLNPYFKGLLLRLDLGFTKGDIDLLRGFKHEASHKLYWKIRSVQWKFSGNKLEMGIDELKESLGVVDQYKDRFDNFKKVILDPIQKEFIGTWVEFEYELVKGGKGGKVQKIIFSFRTDFELEKLLKLGYTYRWEESLSNYGLLERDIVKIRHNVTYKAEIIPGHIWDSFYVINCITIVQQEFAEKQKGKGRQKIKHIGNYLYKGMIEGWWAEKINAKRAKTPANQIDLFNPTEARQIQKFQFSIAEFEELYNDFKKTMRINVSIKDFAKQHNYVIKGDFVEKLG